MDLRRVAGLGGQPGVVGDHALLARSVPPGPGPLLSVCCMTGGRSPGRLAAALRLLRDCADEIVVAVEAPRAEEACALLAGVADVVLSFPPAHPPDRPIPWLFGSCSGDWIFNVDDDEVPSAALIDALPGLVRRSDITHAWIARRWLYPTAATFIARSPWSTEYQLRLVLNDERTLQYSDVFHRPVVCHGPCAFVDAPLWHLDSILHSAERRLAKARAYELERPGMRLGALAHNVGVYLPELQAELPLDPVPDAERETIENVLDGAAPSGSRPPMLVRAGREDVNAAWPGPPVGDALYRASLSVSQPPRVLTAGVQQTIDAVVRNEGDVTWRWGPDARPAIRLAYRWSGPGGPVDEPAALRTALPHDLPPGAGAVVPVHVVPPHEPGAYRLRIDLVHEPDRWFDAGVTLDVGVVASARVLVVGSPERLARAVWDVGLKPDAEPVVVLRDESDREAYGEYAVVPGPRTTLLRGTERRGRLSTLALVAVRSLRLIVRARRRGGGVFVSALEDARALVVVGPNWVAEAAQGRDWAVVLAMVLACRARSVPVVLAEGALPRGPSRRAMLVRAALGRLAGKELPPDLRRPVPVAAGTPNTPRRASERELIAGRG